MRGKQLAQTIAMLAAIAGFAAASGVKAEDLPEKIERMEQELQELKRELQQQKEAQQKAEAERMKEQESAKAAESTALRELAERVKIGAYGSFRFEHSSLDEVKNTFTFRRLVL